MIKFPVRIVRVTVGFSHEIIDRIVDADGNAMSIGYFVDALNATQSPKRQASQLEYPKILEDV